MRTRQRRARRFGLAAAAFGVAMTALLTLGSGAARATPLGPGFQDIGDTGAASHTLTNVTIGNQLSCQDLHFGDTSNEWYNPSQFVNGNCGTFVSLSEGVPTPTTTNYGPPCTQFCFSPTPWTPVSQSPITHPALDTNQVVTVVTSTGGDLRVTQTDTYHVGDEFYTTSVLLEQAGGVGGLSGVLYVAGDCFLQNSDAGFGYTTNGVYCRSGINSTTPGPRLEGYQPITAGSHYMEAGFNTVWAAVGSGAQLPDTCTCADYIDNGAGLSWPFSILGLGPGVSQRQPDVSVSSATFSWHTFIQPLALPTTPNPTPTATPAPTAPHLPPTGAQSPTTPAPAPAAPWLWIGIAAVIAGGGFGLVRKLPRRDI